MFKTCKVILIYSTNKSDVKIYNEHFDLYILSDDIIKENDYCVYIPNTIFSDTLSTVIKVESITDNTCTTRVSTFSKKHCKKVIATTNKDIALPRVPNLFIEKYIKSCIEKRLIKEVQLKYEAIPTEWDNPFTNPEGIPTVDSKYELCLENNFVVIKKDTWTLDEHCLDMQYYMEYCSANGYVTPMEWLDNLKHY
jgi:hypothetical protein